MKIMTAAQFENANVFNNENVQKIIGNIVNESANAALVSVFEDAVNLFEHTTGKFFVAKWEINRKNYTVSFKNFEELAIVDETTSLKESVKDFFDTGILEDVLSSYKKNILSKDRYITETIHDAMSRKSFEETSDYASLNEVKRSDIINEGFVQKYATRIATKPLNKIKFFSFNEDVSVSLIPTESKKTVGSSNKDKAKNLWKQDDFKKALAEASKELVENKDDSYFIDLFESFPALFSLDKAERKIVLGKAVLMNKDLRDSMNIISTKVEKLLKEGEFNSVKPDYITEAEEDAAETEAPTDGETAEEPAPTLTPDELQKIADELTTLSGKVEDEKIKAKLDKLAAKLSSKKDEGTPVEEVKEAISIILGKNIYESSNEYIS